MLPSPDRPTAWVPNVDLFRNPDRDFIIKVELASLRPENIEIAVEGWRLEITGRRPDADREAAGNRYLVTKIYCGPFELVVDVPADSDPTRANAQYRNGILQVVIPHKSP
jgi:HSP20 family protein